VVVAEIAHNGLFERFHLVEADEPGPGADERVPTEPAVLDRLEQEGGTGSARATAQPEIRPERGEEVGGDDGGCVHRFEQQKRPPAEVFERNGLCA
jgi:hypothetical protein